MTRMSSLAFKKKYVTTASASGTGGMDITNSLSNPFNGINLSTSFYFVGAGTDFPDNPRNGSIFFNTAEGMQYVYYTTASGTGGWDPIGSVSNYDETPKENPNFSEVKEMKCESCGAPLKIKSKYDIKCEYCGKVYIGA